MKKILSLVLVAVMLLGALSMTVGAQGSIIFSDSFDKGFASRNWITNPESCHFKWDGDNKCIFGYDDSRVLQSSYGKNGKWWDKFYGSIDFQIRGYDDLPEQEGRNHSVSLWYRDKHEDENNIGAVYIYTVEFETGKFTLTKDHEWKYKDGNGVTQSAKTSVVLAEAVDESLKIEVGDNAPWYELGWRITEGKIECYFEQKLMLTATVNPDDPKLGDYTMNSVDASVGSMKSAFLVFNGGNYIALDNFRVWTPDYDFQDVMYGDVNGDGKVNLADVTKVLQYIAKWELEDFNEAAADVNADSKINLNDATKMLKYIAKWENINLGSAD